MITPALTPAAHTEQCTSRSRDDDSRAGEPRSGDDELRQLSDRELLFRIQLATRRERQMTIKILHHLNEIDRRKLYLGLGHGSLFDYCTRRLKYSSSAAARRIQTARCIRRHPEVLTMLQERELSLSTISLIASILTEDNRASILARVRGRSHREVERVVAQYRPPVAMRDRVRPVRVAVRQPTAHAWAQPVDVGRRCGALAAAALQPVDVDRALVERDLERQLPHVPPPPVPSEAVVGGGTPGAGSASWIGIEQKLFVQFLANEDLMKKLEEVQAILSHRCGDGSFAEVLDLVLTDFLERYSTESRHARRERKKARASGPAEGRRQSDDGRTRQDLDNRGDAHEDTHHSRRRECKRKAKSRQSSQRSRHIPAAVRDQVYVRDAGQCTFIAPNGTRCASKRSLQVDHIQPFALGGTHEPANLRLLCAKHNRLSAEHHMGKHVMRHFWRKE